MARRTRVTMTVVAAMTALLGLTACGGGSSDGAARPTSTSLPDPTASGSDSDRASDPASQQFVEQENPSRFLERWAAAEARMQHGGPAKPYLRLSKTCPACFRLARTVARYYDAGGFVHGGQWHVDSVRPGGTVEGYPVYVVRAHAAAATVRESSSSPEQRVPAGPVTYQIGLIADGSSYTVTSRTKGS